MTVFIQAQDISVVFKQRATPVLYPMSLDIPQGQFVILLGHNGSGKSTLVDVLSGHRTPSSGQVFLKGRRIESFSREEKSLELLTMTQKPQQRLFEQLTLAENIQLWEGRFPAQQRRSCEEILKITPEIQRHFKSLGTRMSEFSGGEKQAILLSLILSHPPAVLFLDEHTSALDPKAASSLMQLTAEMITAHKVTTIMVTHALHDALSYGDRLIVLREGVVVFDGHRSQVKDVHLLKEILYGE